jgi:hypothetical protein
VSYGFDDGERQLADDLSAAVTGYAVLFRRAATIATDGAAADELAEWSAECFDEAVSLRLLEADAIDFATGVPEDAGVLVRELYESLVVLSGVERVAHALSMPVATCADGSSLATLLREKGELSRWFAQIQGRPLVRPDMPDSLVPARTRATPSPFGFGEGRQLAANADRELDEVERSSDLNDVFAGRIAEAMRRYGEAVVDATAGPAGNELWASLSASARAEAPALIGFARLTDRRTVRLDPPPAASPVARLVADAFVTLAAAETAEDIATLPYPSVEDVEDAARPLRNWLGRLGTI